MIIFLCCTYIVPRNSVFFHTSNNMNKLQILQDEISRFKTKGEIIILGDLNARIGTEFVDAFQEPISAIESNVVSDRLLPRSNKDPTINQNGKELMSMINEAHLSVLNGRTPGECQGEFTYHGALGSSTIDLCITSRDVMNTVLYLQVLPAVFFSDHCPISLALKVNRHCSTPTRDSNSVLTPTSHQGEEAFVANMHSPSVTNKLNTFYSMSHDSTDHATDMLSSILTDVSRDLQRLC